MKRKIQRSFSLASLLAASTAILALWASAPATTYAASAQAASSRTPAGPVAPRPICTHFGCDNPTI